MLFSCTKVALSLRDRTAELSNRIDEAFGFPAVPRQGYEFAEE
jgi:hypothetical protein